MKAKAGYQRTRRREVEVQSMRAGRLGGGIEWLLIVYGHGHSQTFIRLRLRWGWSCSWGWAWGERKVRLRSKVALPTEWSKPRFNRAGNSGTRTRGGMSVGDEEEERDGGDGGSVGVVEVRM